ncbi:MAG: hypothetical protein J07HB67_02329 [halophilic archaeon J07HB67]|nr:MAG: hypothetical protein J07HB67_02329 [halophilic archaeon J07HB67]
MTRRHELGRRGVLRSIGAAVGTAGVAGLGSAHDGHDDTTPIGAAGANNDRGLPVAADGRLVVTLERVDASQFRVQSRFHSDALNERYGTRTLEYEPSTVPAEEVPETLRTDGASEYSFQTQRVIGTQREQRTAERTIWKQQVDDEQTHPLYVPDMDGNVPLYSYASESGAQGGGLQDRTSPMNVAWDATDTADIESDMESGTNGSEWGNEWIYPDFLVKDLYVNLPDGGTRSTTGHVMQSSGWCPTEQYHVRLYDVPYYGVSAIGQAHYDPCLHGNPERFLSKIPMVELDVDWQLDRSRGEVDDFWETGHGANAEYTYVGNTTSDFASHDGWWMFFDE